MEAPDKYPSPAALAAAGERQGLGNRRVCAGNESEQGQRTQPAQRDGHHQTRKVLEVGIGDAGEPSHEGARCLAHKGAGVQDAHERRKQGSLHALANEELIAV